MDFNLTEERSILQDTLRRFLNDNYSHEDRRKLIAAGEPYNVSVMAGLADLGVFGALFTEEQGGFGGAGFDISVVFEELGRAGAIEPLLPMILAGGVIARSMDKELTDSIITGEHSPAFAHSEPAARYQLQYVATTAVKNGDTIVLNGTKTQVLNGAQSDSFVVSARESGNVSDVDGISVFLVPADQKGLSVVSQVHIDGTSSSTLTMENVVVEKSTRLVPEGLGFSVIEEVVAHAITALCAEALGAMEVAKELTVEYLRERKQFGIAIGKFQALQHRMADLLIEIEQVRSAVINLAGNLMSPRDVRETYVSAAKNLTGRVSALVAEESIQMHGGIGMTDEYALSHYARRLTMVDHMFGDVDYHLERFIALKSK